MSTAMSGLLVAQTPTVTMHADSPVAEVANISPWEYGALLQGGVGLEQRTNFIFPFWQSYTPKFQRISCTGVEVGCSAPYTVGGTYTGVSITPIMLRWNFTHGKRFMPWVEGAGGVVWTNHKYPAVGDLNPADPTQTGPAADTSVWNFTPQGGIGAHYFLKPRRSVDFSANAVHISSASLGDKNPGVNVSLQVSVGYTWWK